MYAAQHVQSYQRGVLLVGARYSRAQIPLIGQAASLVIGVFVLCCACTFGLAAVRSTGQAVGLVATNTPTRAPTNTPPPTNTPEATETPQPSATPAPTNTALPAPTVAPPTAKPTRTPIPTETFVPTFTPEPTIETDAAGIEPVNGECIYPYFIKISRNGLAHSISSRSYSRTIPVHCYAHMRVATDAGYTEAGD
jgi:hypothetical protein